MVNGKPVSRVSRGYTLVALTIGIAIMLILIAAVLPLASTEMQREREEELIFRGKQYAEAIRCFRTKYGRPPNTLKEMIETKPRTLRKLWKDPITNSSDWGLITMMGAPIGSQPGGPDFGGGGPKGTPTPAPTPRGGGGKDDEGKGGILGGGPQPLLPILGVHSKSSKKALRTFLGRDTYDQWQFTEQTLMQSGNEGMPQMGPGGVGTGGGKR